MRGFVDGLYVRIREGNDLYYSSKEERVAMGEFLENQAPLFNFFFWT